MRPRRAVALFACSLLVLAGCSKEPTPSRAVAREATLTVLAASSLTEAFTAIGDEFEARETGVTVRLSFGPSDGLAAQIQGGAPADVFASASAKWMDAVADDPGVSDRTDFARHRLAVIVPWDDPAGIRSVQDLGNPGVRLVLAAEGVPAGDYGRQMLDNAGISERALRNVVSNATDVKGVVHAVTLGDADAGIVYVTDVTGDVRDHVKVIDVPDDVNVVATYPIAAVNGAADASLARRFVSFVMGPGQRALNAAGFLAAL